MSKRTSNPFKHSWVFGAPGLALETRCVLYALQPHIASFKELVEGMFAPETLHLARLGYGLFDTARHTYQQDQDIHFQVQLTAEGMLYPAQMQIMPGSKFEALHTAMDHALGRWARVRAMVAWFDVANTTPGAVKHYWPTMENLLPVDNTMLAKLVSTGGAFKEPRGISAIVPQLRETMETVAEAILLPELDWPHKSDILVSWTHTPTWFGICTPD